MWEFLGGKIKVSETASECFTRELMVEFEIAVDVGDYVGTNVYAYKTPPKRLAYKRKYISEQFKLDYHGEIKWINI